ncbi:MAG: EamA family transporter [Candidatus Falkowbacteria bacterium]|nr:EamA family transporter [Candidatus Falkowbacteria bacterium]
MFSINNKLGLKPGQLAGALAIMLAALLWSIDGLFIRPQFYVLPAELVVFLEHLLGFIVLSPFIFIFWPKIKSLSRKSWLALGWISLFGGMIGTIFITKAFFAAMDGNVSFATVVILQKLQPIFALLLARVILKERLDKKFYGWAAVAIVASYFIAFAKTGLDLSSIDWSKSGALFAFIAAFAFGSSTVFGKRVANHLDYKAVAALRFGLTSILVFILVALNGSLMSLDLVSSRQWELLALIVLTSGAGAMFVYYFGLRRVPASAATILELFWPFSALVLDYVFNHNYLNLAQLLALVILLLAFYKISVLGRLKKMSFFSRVIRGQGKGKAIGWPTANLDKVDLDMPHGIYAVKVKLAGRDYLGLLHFGFKDIFKKEVSLEVFIKDFSGDIYGANLEIEVLEKIREVKSFANSDLLVEAIKSDLEVLKRFA